MNPLQSSSFKNIMQYVKPYKIRFNAVIVWALFLAVFSATRPYVFKYIIDDFLLKASKHSDFLLLIGAMGGILLLEVTSQYFFTYWANWLGQDIIKDIRIQLFKHIVSFKMQFFDKESVGKLVTRTVSDIESIASIFSQGLFMIVSDILKMLIVIIFMFSINWKIALIVIASMPIILWATNIFRKKMRKAFKEVRTEISNLNSFVQERVTGIKIVQLFNREAIEYEKFKEINKKHNKAWLKNILYNSIFFPFADSISSISLGLMVYFGALFIVNGDTSTTIGHLISFNMYIALLYQPLRHIADKFNVMQMGLIASERVFAILKQKKTITNSGMVLATHFKGNIQFKNVHFSYIKNEEVLRGINLDIKQGETIAIIGSTGAGKSTIVNVLNRFYEINSGTIFIDNVNIKEYQLESLRQQISIVLQDVFLFADSIYNNITLFNENITKNEVITAAKQIGVHHFIMSLPNGYDYNVKERGVMLSSGQRQLIAFLRAYVSNPGILILDEATSSVDTHTEELIQKATIAITKNRTSIVIAHRLATIINADKIIVMEKGKIVEIGTHKQLMETASGYYQKLYYSQFYNK